MMVQTSFKSALLNPTTASERHSSSILLGKDATPPPPPVGKQQMEWDGLTHGVQWAIIKIVCENDLPTNPRQTRQAFSFVVSAVLRLKRRQIQAFLSVYVDDYERWDKFQKTSATIDWPTIIQLSRDRGLPLHQLLPKNRPRLSTDSISPEAVSRGVAFLHVAGLRNFAERLTDWIGTNIYGDFIVLAVEAELLRDYLDGRSLRKAAMLGWIDLKQIRNNLIKQRTESGLATRMEANGIFSQDFEGDPSPIYFGNEYEQLRIKPRKSTAKQTQVTQTHDYSNDATGHKKGTDGAAASREITPAVARHPTQQETQDTCAAFDRLITVPHGAWRTGVSGAQVTTMLERQQLLPKTRSAAARSEKEQTNTDTDVDSPDIQPTRNIAASRARGAPRGSNVAAQPGSGTGHPKQTSRKAGSNKASTVAENQNCAQSSEVMEETRETIRAAPTNNRSTRSFSHSTSTFAPIQQGSATPDSLPPHQQLHATAKADEFSQSASQSPQEQESIHNPLKRNRRPSRRLLDNMESDTEYKPESDDDVQPARKKQQQHQQQQQQQSRKTTIGPKKAAAARRPNSQLDGPKSDSPSPQPQVQVQEVGEALLTPRDGDVVGLTTHCSSRCLPGTAGMQKLRTTANRFPPSRQVRGCPDRTQSGCPRVGPGPGPCSA